ncbi:MAG: hypothetical protein R3F11_10540 [Verrucomicrobiales bacterium]
MMKILIEFSDEEIVEVAHHTAFTAIHIIEDETDEAWHAGKVALDILSKLEEGYPGLREDERLVSGDEIELLKTKVEAHFRRKVGR